jgi:hypothetical protein
MVTRLLTLAGAVLLLSAAPAQAAIFNVANTNDSGPGSLRQAVLNSNGNNQEDTINVPAGTYSLTSGQLTVTDPLGVTIAGAGAESVLLASQGNFRVFCVTAGDEVVLQGLTIHGGRASPGGQNCSGGEGGGISSSASILRVTGSIVQHNDAAPTRGGGGGIYASGDLFVDDTIVRHNAVTALSALGNNGGGGIYWAGTGFPSFSVTDSTIYENTATVAGNDSGGGGIWSNAQPTIENATLTGNLHRVGSGALSNGGGGGIFVLGGAPAGSIEHVTFSANHSDRSGGAIARGAAGVSPSLKNSVLNANTASTNPDCSPGAVSSAGGNLSSTPGPTCNLAGNDQAGVDPQLGALAVNGSNNGTLTHELLSRQSPAVEFGVNCSLPADQRGVSRSQFGANCDSGAYEFDGRASAQIPNCSPNGQIQLALDEPPGGDVVGLSYRIDGGPEIQENTGDVGEAPTPASVTLPEGRHTLEYFGRWTNGIEQGHGLDNALVDKTRPRVDVRSEQRSQIYVIRRRATINVQASDALSGLVSDPSGAGERVSTASRGRKTVSRTATDLCGHQATDSIDYRVLGPGLGIRAVIEVTRGTVRFGRRAGGGAAGAAQKGQRFTALREPREVPVGTFVDTRRGRARITTSTNRRTGIQDGQFSASVFQVLQSRRPRARGLTELRLKGSSFRRCGTAGRGKAAAAQSRLVRRLRANARGRFRTRGRHSAATVRGTVWLTADRCDGTLTRVTRGRVAVRDFRRRRTILLRAGKSYLARPR